MMFVVHSSADDPRSITCLDQADTLVVRVGPRHHRSLDHVTIRPDTRSESHPLPYQPTTIPALSSIPNIPSVQQPCPNTKFKPTAQATCARSAIQTASCSLQSSAAELPTVTALLRANHQRTLQLVSWLQQFIVHPCLVVPATSPCRVRRTTGTALLSTLLPARLCSSHTPPSRPAAQRT